MNKNLENNLKRVKKSAQELALTEAKIRDSFLKQLSQNLLKKSKGIILANQKDIRKMDSNDPTIDRLELNQKRIKAMARDIKTVSSFPDPLKEIIEKRTLKNGLKLIKKRVPLGVVAVIYESRPNVTCDVVSLGIKSGNALVLKGGKESDESNKFLVKIIKETLKDKGLPQDSVYYIDAGHKSFVNELFKAHDYLDVIIPRGGQGLINFVRQNSQVPVIETGAGVCHTYIDKDADIKMALKIVYNAKTSRPSVCNALDTLLIHKDLAKKALQEFTQVFKGSGVQVRADSKSYPILKGLKYEDLKLAQEKDFGEEFLSLKMSIKVVSSLEEAIAHINKFGSGHSEAIISKDKKAGDKFINEVDAACVYINTSTRFTDGSEFGLGGEIGISTQKLQARGPMGLKELTSYKWIIQGNGQIRV